MQRIMMEFRNLRVRCIVGQSVIAACGVLAVLGPVFSRAAEDAAAEGSLDQRLVRRINVMWKDSPLRHALNGLVETQHVAIVLDRRVDPTQKVDLTANDMPLASILETVADQLHLSCGRLGDVVYLGPPDVAPQLSELAMLRTVEAKRLPAAAARKFLEAKAMAWADLAEPRALLAALAEKNGLGIDGLQEVPHDLWPAQSLPPLSLVDRLTLLAGQFGLTFAIAPDGKRVTLTPIPAGLAADMKKSGTLRTPVSLLPQTAQRPAGNATQKQTAQPTKRNAQPETSDDLSLVRIDRLVVQEQPLDAVLQQVAKRLGLKLQIDEQGVARAGISLQQHVSATVENGTVDDLLRELVKSTGLRCRRTGRTVEIGPAK